MKGRNCKEKPHAGDYAWLESLYHSARIGIGLVSHPDRIMEQVNQKICEMTGYSEEDLIGNSTRMLYPSDEEYRYVGRMKIRDIKEKGSGTVEARWRKKDGTVIDVLLSTNPLDAQRIELGFAFTAIDITERKQYEKNIKDSEARYRALFEQSKDAVFIISLDGRPLAANKRASEMLGYSQDEFPKLTLGDLSAEAEKSTDVRAKVLEGERVPPYERLLRKKSGEVLETEISLEVVRDNSGRPMHLQSVVRDITDRKKAEKKLQQSREWYRTLAEDIPALVCRLTPDLVFTYVNDAYCLFIGKDREEIIGRALSSFVPPENFGKVKTQMAGLTPDLPIATHEHTNKAHDGSLRWVRWTNRAIFNAEDRCSEFLCIGEDIDDQKKYFDALKRSETLKSSIIAAIPDVLIRYDREGAYLDILTEDESRLYFPRRAMLGKTVHQVLPIELAEKVIEKLGTALREDGIHYLEYKLQIQDGERDFEARFKACGENEVMALIRDITDRKNYEKQLEFLSFHDQLTGLYNRVYFERALKDMQKSVVYPITFICADIDGLKMINDTFGLRKGDEILKICAKVIGDSLRKKDLLVRTGGDEFTVILSNTTIETGEIVGRRIRESIDRYNQEHVDLPLSISMGVAGTDDQNRPLMDLLKEADDAMNHDKLSRSTSVRNQIVETLLAALAERDFVTEGHTRRLAEHCRQMGAAARLNSQQLTNLALLSQVHDLGKVGIPDQILFKQGPLDDDEWEIMKKHAEIGHRIALSSSDLSVVADLILKHQEKWDGSGYPLGLKGEEIPIECRILAIIDAFDAMTNDRPYRKALPVSKALAEIKANSGTQFDPTLETIFLSLLKGGDIVG